MNNRFRVSGLLVRQLKEQKVSLSAVLGCAGLPAGFFRQEKIFATTAELFALWRAIGETSNDPAIGLKLVTEARTERYDPAAIAALCSHSFRDAVHRMARYKQLTCPEEIRIHSEKEETTVEFAFLLAEEAEPVALVDVCLAWILDIGRLGTGVRIAPLRLDLLRPVKHREILEAHFGCRVKFQAGRNALVFRTSDLERRFVTHNAELLSMIGPRLDAELDARQSRPAISDQVKSALKHLLAGQRPSIQNVARQLGLSSRTLQRRLTDGGVTFQQMVEEARRELAHHYLGQSSLELNEIAYLLGYEDTNSFFRAFRHWEGNSPGEWRSHRRSESAAKRRQTLVAK
jgi:AraC-like DNA-binding protein